VSESHSYRKGINSIRSTRTLKARRKKMALFAAIGDRFVAKILKQVATDYNLDFEEMKTRYCGKSSFELMVPTKQVTVDLEEADPVSESEPEIEAEVAVSPPKPKAKKAKATKAKAVTTTKLMALSKMKKPDLVAECEERGLDSEGTVAQLKERIKEARDSEGDAKPTKAKAAPKEKKAAEPKEKKPKAASKKKAAPPPPPVEEPLEEEEIEPDSPGAVRAAMLRKQAEPEAEDDELFEDEEEEEDMQTRLRKILAEAEEEEFADEDETQIVDN
jgi:hypothetical protein